jgi:hypothetical protein
MADVQIAVIDQQNTQIALAAPSETEVTVAVPGVQGPVGEGVPAGGTANQVLFKQSGTDYDTAWSEITSEMIGDLEIVNADVATNAAIAGTKISPNFGSQNVVTTGTATAAALIPSGSSVPTNGVYLPSANNVAISTNGQGRLFVTSAGDVCLGSQVGANNDGSGLSIYNANFPRISFRNSTTGNTIGDGTQFYLVDSDFYVTNNENAALIFRTNSAERLRITSNGNITVPGSLGNFFISGNGAEVFFSRNSNNNLLANGGTSANLTTGANNAFIVQTGSTLTERLRITSDGKLGLGTSSPGFKLTIEDSTTPRIRIGDGVRHVNLDGGSATQNAAVGTDYTGSFGIYTNGAANTRLHITSAGLVGIGTTSPLSRLNTLGTQGNWRIDPDSVSGEIQAFTTNTANSGFIDYRIRTNQTIFDTGGSERARITSDGKLGLGTSSPISLCHISGPEGTYGQLRIQATGAGEDALVAFSTASNGRGIYVDESDSNKLKIYAGAGKGAAGEVTIDNSGNVGIGTTSPSFDLTIDKDSNSVVTSYTRSYNTGSSAGGRVSAASAVGTIAISAYSAAHSIWPSSTVLNSDSGFTGGLNIYQTGANPIVLWTNDFERARIDSSGRLLVGTSSTTRGGAGDITAQGSSVGAGLRLQTSLTSPADGVGLGYIYYADAGRIESATIGAHRDGGTWASGSSQPTRLVFSTTADGASSPTERMRITSNGHVLLNTSTDLAFFSVVDDTYGASDLFIRTFGASSASFIVRGDGDCENTNNSYGAFSDVKLKENVSDASSQWSDIKALRVRKFNLKTRPSDTHIGLIAQETELVSPGLVSELPDRDEDGNDLGTVTKSVKYSVLYMKAVKALQEAMERIETLETSNADLLARVSVLEQG